MSDDVMDDQPMPTLGAPAWNAKSTLGRNPIFESPEQLWDMCNEYFKWVYDNPLMSVELVKFQGVGTPQQVPRMRAMTTVGLCNFLDISRQTWTNYRNRPDFLETCERVESIILQQKVEGAAADLLNPNFIGREIGLVDKQEVVNKDGGQVTHVESEYVEP